jgi:hypothetical protein
MVDHVPHEYLEERHHHHDDKQDDQYNFFQMVVIKQHSASFHQFTPPVLYKPAPGGDGAADLPLVRKAKRERRPS